MVEQMLAFRAAGVPGYTRVRREPDERYYQALLESSQDIFTVVNPDGTIRYESPAIEIWLGYTPDELVGRQAFDYIHPEDCPRIRALFEQGVEEPGSVVSAEFRFRHRDGSWRIFDSRATNLIADPVVRGVIVHGRDITERRHLERAMRSAHQRLVFAEKMEALGRMAGGVVHDFKNSLFIVSAHAELLAEKVAPELRGAVEEIRKAAERGAQLVHQLGAFARHETGKAGPIDLGQVVDRLEKTVARIAGKPVAVVVHCPEGPTPVALDEESVTRVILDLVNNALHAMPGGGTLTVGVDEVDIPALEEPALGGPGDPEHPPGRYVRLRVEDTGEGMDKAVQARIFEPFFTTKETGTGLGLAEVYAVVRNLGGFVEVASEPSKGSRFELFFPRST